MSLPLWKTCLDNFRKILSILEANPTLVLLESDEPEPEVVDEELGLTSEDIGAAGVTPAISAAESKQVSGSLIAFIQRLDDEFTKSLQAIDPHTKEYVGRLQDEPSFLEICERTQTYYERVGKLKHGSRVAGRRVEHLYYKLDSRTPFTLGSSGFLITPTTPATSSTETTTTPTPTPTSDNNNDQAAASQQSTTAAAPLTASSTSVSSASKEDTKELLEKLTHLIYTHGDERLKTRTMLCHIYYHAIHDRFYEVC